MADDDEAQRTGRCGGCKHWDRKPFQEGFTSVPLGKAARGLDRPQRDALSHQIEQRYGVCRGVVEVPEWEDEPPIAYTMDASQYMARLNTTAEFGCILFKPGTVLGDGDAS